jgi:hypothetical protein
MRFSDWHENGKRKSEGTCNDSIKTETIECGRTEDKVATKVKRLADIHGNFSYYDVSRFAREEINADVWNELNRGRAIPETLDQLNYYWKSHAPMIRSQWENVFNHCRIDSYSGDVEIVDYGCRDGLASLLFLDKFYSDFKKGVSKVKLIEPSSLALKRAKTVLQCYIPNAQTVDINKKLDELEEKDLETGQNLWKIHLFSNILDIDDFDIAKLFNRIIESKGDHTFLAVSHDRNFLGGTPRLDWVYRVFTESKYDHLKINWSDQIKFNCTNRSQSPAVCFIIDLKVL